jgi:hypothetical protein
MKHWWVGLKQWLYPPGCRLPVGDDETLVLLSVAHMLSMADSLAWASAAAANPLPPPGEPAPAAKPPAVGPEKAFVIDLCNQVHRLSRWAAKVEEQGGADADRLKGHMERLARVLDEHKVKWADLSGQVFEAGLSDFEPLGDPQPTPGLQRPTIIRCERPVVRLGGKVLQAARGTVGVPPV